MRHLLVVVNQRNQVNLGASAQCLQDVEGAKPVAPIGSVRKPVRQE